MTSDPARTVTQAAISLAALPPNQNRFPWRTNRTPYRIFLAEFLLIRTRADVVSKKYEEIVRLCPTPRELALVNEQELADLLAPLGLRKRVPLLLSAAKFIVEEFDGELPSEPDQLVRIPGIGKYTADAIAAFAFYQQRVPADVNILRFLARLTGLDMEHPTKGSVSIRRLLPLLTQDRGGPPAEALLDFTRLVCKPRKPKCPDCILRSHCYHGRHPLAATDSVGF